MTTPTKTFTFFVQMASPMSEEQIQILGFIPALQSTEEKGPPSVFSMELGDHAESVPEQANALLEHFIYHNLAWKTMWIQ